MFNYLKRFILSTYDLFTIHQYRKKFKLHRVVGMLYLIQYIYTVYLEILGTPNKLFFLSLPITGFIQTIIACYTFTFLPRAGSNTQGYYTDKKVMSYDFILENIYFSGLLLWQSVYLYFSKEIRSNSFMLPIEILFNFFPYYTIRHLVPKSSFRNSIKNGNTYAMVVKVFYCIAKHFSGYYVNYLCFIGYLGDDPIMNYALVRSLFLLGGWGTTIAMFLQTLKFKKYISSFSAMILYAGSFPFFYTCYAALISVAMEHLWLTVLTLIGFIINFRTRKMQIFWQIMVCGLLLKSRIMGRNV